MVLSSKVEVKEGPPVKIKNLKQPFAKVEVRDEKNQIVSSNVHVDPEPTILSSIVEVVSNDRPVLSSIIEIKSSSDEEPAVEVDGNNIDKPEYDFLNRQPSEVVDESYRVSVLRPSIHQLHNNNISFLSGVQVIDLKPNSKFHLKPKSRNNQHATKDGKRDGHSTGVVTKYGGTVVKDGATTVHETQVIGTYISGKYAQVSGSPGTVGGTSAFHGYLKGQR